MAGGSLQASESPIYSELPSEASRIDILPLGLDLAVASYFISERDVVLVEYPG
jgi:hypothetical protein